MIEISKKRSSISFFMGFIGIVSLSFVLLVAVGYYQTEIAEKKNVSSAGVVSQPAEAFFE
ncbi:MAG: hypothetical protein EXS47_01745 [Candidatus Zambryskibacteria bacterium]|nr:hypothetical protein [Candidatus Zambryskibacteria bacterium]